jgi:putative transposase
MTKSKKRTTRPKRSVPKKKIQAGTYDYSSAGVYYVSLRMNSIILFGHINNRIVEYNKLGDIAVKAWTKIPLNNPNITLDTFLIMPDHIHGIIITNSQNKRMTKAKRYELLTKVIKSFKDDLSKSIKREIPKSDFKWQRSFYDRIIKNDDELNWVRKFIAENPSRRKPDV